jgi:hypothetical protein
MPSKPWWQSKTLWFNILSIVGVALAAVLQSAGDLHIPASWIAVLTVVVAVVNMVLRLVTSQPISGTPAARSEE